MIHYAVSLLILSLVLVTPRTFDECFNCEKNDPYSVNSWYICSNDSVIRCFDELTRNVSINKEPVITLTEVQSYSTNVLMISYPRVPKATHYILKGSHYFSHTTAVVSFCGVKKAAVPLVDTESITTYIDICEELNITIYPVTANGIGTAAFTHYKPTDFPCQFDDNGKLCNTLSIRPKVDVYDVKPTCNSEKLDWQAQFDIDRNIPWFLHWYGWVDACRFRRSISVYACESKMFCTAGPCNDVLRTEYDSSRDAYFNKFTKCDHSNIRHSNTQTFKQSSFCTSYGNPMQHHVVSTDNEWWMNFHSCNSTTLVEGQSVQYLLKNRKLIMPQINYDSVYKLIFVMGFSNYHDSPLPNTTFRNWMVDFNTTYTYYLRTYSRQGQQCMANKQTNETTELNLASVLSIGFGTVILLILVLIATVMVIYRRSRKKHSMKKRFNESMELREERYHDMIRCPSDDDIFEIDCERVVIFKDQVLGQGAFGKVYKGKIKGLAMTSFHAASKLTDDQELAENMLVAVKQCYEFADATTKREFLREIEIMKELYQHESLVNILHCITQYPHKPFSLIVEYCEHGDLLKFLQNSKVYLEKLKTDEPDNEKIILFDDVAQITFEVGDGMAYLAEKGYVHRDLAARNIMVKKGKHVKIGDFGLCRSVVSQDDVYTTKGGKLPIKWMAIESLYDYQFSTKSDVWSYGVLLYEVTTLGLQPYADVVPQDGDFRRAMIAHLRSGARLEKPPSCPDEIYTIMEQTWAEKPENRASFDEIRETARRLVESLHDLDGGVYGDQYVGVEVNRCDQSDGEECI